MADIAKAIGVEDEPLEPTETTDVQEDLQEDEEAPATWEAPRNHHPWQAIGHAKVYLGEVAAVMSQMALERQVAAKDRDSEAFIYYMELAHQASRLALEVAEMDKKIAELFVDLQMSNREALEQFRTRAKWNWP